MTVQSPVPRFFAVTAALLGSAYAACAVAAPRGDYEAGTVARADMVAGRGEASETRSEARTGIRARQKQLGAVRSWAIQLRYLNAAEIAASPLDLIVMDHAPHPKNQGEMPYRREDIAALKSKPDGSRRLVIAYLSIGEAERYRSYWQPEWDAPETRPSWLKAENPQWPGNYLVRYSDPAWQSLIFGSPQSYLDRIMAAGFDGVYLDRVDAFQDDGEDNAEAEDAMVRFVSRLCDSARRIDPRFIVIMQNGEELIRYGALRQRIDGISKEDLAYGNDNTAAPNAPEMVRDSLQYLRKARKAGLSVFAIEYVTEPDRIAAVRKLATREGFVLYIAERLLSSLKHDGIARDPSSDPAAAATPSPDAVAKPGGGSAKPR